MSQHPSLVPSANTVKASTVIFPKESKDLYCFDYRKHVFRVLFYDLIWIVVGKQEWDKVQINWLWNSHACVDLFGPLMSFFFSSLECFKYALKSPIEKAANVNECVFRMGCHLNLTRDAKHRRYRGSIGITSSVSSFKYERLQSSDCPLLLSLYLFRWLKFWLL